MVEKIKQIINTKTLFIALSILFAIPSIIYLIQNKSIVNFESSYQFLLTNSISRIDHTIVFFILFIGITILYFGIIKKHKELFKNIKNIIIFVAIITVLFAIILPFTSSDIFYYIGVGWLDSSYNQNPYYTSMSQYMEQNEQAQKDTMLLKGGDYWGEQTVVYGPIWQLFCKTFAWLSTGNIDIAFFIFKLAAILIHIANTYLIYKITRKKVFPIIYGLNPFILLEAIANLHNDLYIIFFMLASIYFLLRKKNILLSVIILAIATCIKYFTILLLPFILIYYFRKEKSLAKRFINCIKYALIFIVILIIPYIVYIQDVSILKGIADQQGKYTKSIQTVMMLNGFEQFEQLQKMLIIGFAFLCIIVGINAITKKQITLNFLIKRYNYLLYIFMFILITNFQPWYLMWLFPTMMLQNATALKQIIGISITSQIANCTFLAHGENFKYSEQFVIIMAVGILISVIYSLKNKGVNFFERTVNSNRWK